MTANEYQKLAMRTMNTHLTWNDQLVNGALGLNGEAGEIADMIKKRNYQGHGMDNTHLLKELGDVLWYVALLATHLDTSIEEIMCMNIEKLQARYPNGFDAEYSLNRKEGDI